MRQKRIEKARFHRCFFRVPRPRATGVAFRPKPLGRGRRGDRRLPPVRRMARAFDMPLSPGCRETRVRLPASLRRHFSKCPSTLQQVSADTSASVRRHFSKSPSTLQQVSADTSASVLRHFSKCPPALQHLSSDTSASLRRYFSICPPALQQVSARGLPPGRRVAAGGVGRTSGLRARPGGREGAGKSGSPAPGWKEKKARTLKIL